MFRRRAPKRGPQGFARPQEDITTLGDEVGDLLTAPVRDAPPLARNPARDVPRAAPAQPRRPAPAA